MHGAIPVEPEQNPQSYHMKSAGLRIFISHSHTDDTFGLHLASDLRRELGDSDAVWYDSGGGLRGGEEWWDEIVRQISARPIFLVILSPDAMASRWVRDEIRIAWTLKNTSDKRRIIPILVRPTEDIRADLRSLQIISFVSQSYSDGLKQVFSSLGQPTKAKSGRPSGSGPAVVGTRDDIGAYWRSRGQPWRTESEISADRQSYLTEKLSVVPDVAAGVFPFAGIKLERADVEWLLGQLDGGPINWHDDARQRSISLDLRGADLRSADLNGLPLSRALFGLEAAPQRLRGTPTVYDLARLNASEEQRQRAAAALDNAILWETHLEGACLSRVSLRGADLGAAHLEAADLTLANLENADLTDAVLNRARLNDAQLDGANLRGASLQGSQLSLARLVGAQLIDAHLEGADLAEADFTGADLRHTFFDAGSDLRDITLLNARIVGTHWRDADLTTISWGALKFVGDEMHARERGASGNESKVAGLSGSQRRREHFLRFQDAFRASRQLATALAAQGVEDADRFAYRAAVLQRRLHLQRGKLALYTASFLLDIIAGYGYRLGRTLMIYFYSIVGFALAYFELGRTAFNRPINLLEALIISITAFHGRGFFPSTFAVGDLLSGIAACEAVIGLLVEITLVASFSRRAFGRQG